MFLRTLRSLAINKVDLLKDKSRLLGLIKTFDALGRFEAIVPTSVKKESNLVELMQSLKPFLPIQDFIYETDEITDKSERFLAAEIIREKVFRLTGQELPYSVAIEIEKFEQEGSMRYRLCISRTFSAARRKESKNLTNQGHANLGHQ